LQKGCYKTSRRPDVQLLKVLVESARAVAQSAVVAEQAWKVAKDNGVEIVAADIPTLFEANANPGETFIIKEQGYYTDWLCEVQRQEEHIAKAQTHAPQALISSHLPGGCPMRVCGAAAAPVLVREPWLAQPSSYCVPKGRAHGHQTYVTSGRLNILWSSCWHWREEEKGQKVQQALGALSKTSCSSAALPHACAGRAQHLNIRTSGRLRRATHLPLVQLSCCWKPSGRRGGASTAPGCPPCACSGR